MVKTKIKGYEGKIIIKLNKRKIVYDIFFLNQEMLHEKILTFLKEFEEEIISYDLKVNIVR